MGIVSLGMDGLPVRYEFSAPFEILSSGPGFWGGPGTLTELPGNVLEGVDGDGIIRFLGAYTSISRTAPDSEFWHGFTVGIAGTAPGLSGNQTVVLRVQDDHGGVALQSFQVTVAPARLYNYTMTANDADGDRLTYALLSAPDGMSIDPATGLVQWTPLASQVGTSLVTLAVADPAGAQGLQRFALTVNVNQAPRIASTPPAVVTAGLPYRYDLQANDPDGGHLNFTLTSGPAGMTVDALGRVSWSPGGSDLGTQHVVLTVADDQGAAAPQAFDVQVVADTQAPKINLTVGAGRVNVGSDVTFTVTATDNVKVQQLTLTVAGTPVGLDANGSATVPMDAVGLISVVAGATDPAGNTSTATASVRVVDPTDAQGPMVRITSPGTDATVTSLTQIVGTATDPHLEFYRVDYAPFDQVDMNNLAQSTAHFVAIAQGNAPVTDGVLGTFDPTMLLSDAYVIRVLAQNVNGNVTAQGIVLNVSGNLIFPARGPTSYWRAGGPGRGRPGICRPGDGRGGGVTWHDQRRPQEEDGPEAVAQGPPQPDDQEAGRRTQQGIGRRLGAYTRGPQARGMHQDVEKQDVGKHV
jgi:hypothetical protein